MGRGLPAEERRDSEEGAGMGHNRKGDCGHEQTVRFEVIWRWDPREIILRIWTRNGLIRHDCMDT